MGDDDDLHYRVLSVRVGRQIVEWRRSMMEAKLHATHISLIERGRRAVRIETIVRLARALGVQPGELMPPTPK